MDAKVQSLEIKWRGEEEYEQALAGAVWNGRKPSRKPAGIVLARSAAEVAAAVQLASERNLQVSVRAGGHSFSAAGVREGRLLIDVSRLNGIEINEETNIAIAGPGIYGQAVMNMVASKGLFFPAGHCPTVAIGGFLLGGGIGWNFRDCGVSCASVAAVEVVLANGEIILADDKNYSDVYWAARGAGPGFFGVVTAFHLKLRPAPRLIRGSFAKYPIEMLSEVINWLSAIRHEVPINLEQALYVMEHDAGKGHSLFLGSFAFGATEEQAEASIRIVNEAPLSKRANWFVGEARLTVEHLTSMPNHTYPQGLRYATDNILTNASGADIVPALEAIVKDFPTPRSHFDWINLVGMSDRAPDMAYSAVAETNIELYSVWENPNDDATLTGWAGKAARSLEPWAVGSQMSGENMLGRTKPADFFTPEALKRLERLRGHYDPDRRFAGFLLKPE